jgi:hypothetical protein
MAFEMAREAACGLGTLKCYIVAQSVVNICVLAFIPTATGNKLHIRSQDGFQTAEHSQFDQRGY